MDGLSSVCVANLKTKCANLQRKLDARAGPNTISITPPLHPDIMAPAAGPEGDIVQVMVAARCCGEAPNWFAFIYFISPAFLKGRSIRRVCTCWRQGRTAEHKDDRIWRRPSCLLLHWPDAMLRKVGCQVSVVIKTRGWLREDGRNTPGFTGW